MLEFLNISYFKLQFPQFSSAAFRNFLPGISSPFVERLAFQTLALSDFPENLCII